MTESKKVSKAHSKLLVLRDNVFFDRLKQEYGIVPCNPMKRSSMLRLANALASQARTTEQADRTTSKIKRGRPTVGNIDAKTDEEAFIHNLASKLASDPSLRESAAILCEMLR